MDLDDALRAEVFRGVKKITSVGEAAKFFGAPRQQNRAIADFLGVTIRAVQRWRTTGAQRRRPRPDLWRRLQDESRRRAIRPKLDRFRRRGARVKLVGRVRVSADVRRRDLPDVVIPPGQMADVVDAIDAGDWSDAAARFEFRFFENYGLNPSTSEIEDVDVVRVRPG